jgi:hypothetical protein
MTQLVDVKPFGTFCVLGADVQGKRQRRALVANHDPHTAESHAHRISNDASRQGKESKHQSASEHESVEAML